MLGPEIGSEANNFRTSFYQHFGGDPVQQDCGNIVATVDIRLLGQDSCKGSEKEKNLCIPEEGKIPKMEL
jgi:hypothetical protein